MSATFDTGMLIALDRNDREAWAVLRRLINRDEVPTVPTAVTAQAWRDGRRQARLARALANCRPEELDVHLAKRAGELCGRAGTSDIVDAIVVHTAASRGDDVYTGDNEDLGHLAAYLPRSLALFPVGS